jgi:hypothetical protein
MSAKPAASANGDAPMTTISVSASALIALLDTAKQHGTLDAWCDVASQWITAADERITELLANISKAHQKLDDVNEIIFRAENAAMACDTLQPTIRMMTDKDIQMIYELTNHE